MIDLAEDVGPDANSTARAKVGGSECLGRTLEALRGELVAVAARVLGQRRDHADVEDVVADACADLVASAFRRHDASRATFAAFAKAIVRHKALKLRRDRACHAAFHERMRSALAQAHPGHARRVDAIRDLRLVLARLCPAQRDVLLAIDLEGERIQDAADRLRTTYAAVNSQVGHARARARRIAATM